MITKNHIHSVLILLVLVLSTKGSANDNLSTSLHKVTGEELTVCAPLFLIMVRDCGDLSVGLIDSLISNLGLALNVLQTLISDEGLQCYEAAVPFVRCVTREVGDNILRTGPLILLPTQACYLWRTSVGVDPDTAVSECAACCRASPQTCANGCFPQTSLPGKDDVALVIDNTGSMADDARALLAGVNSLLSTLASRSSDYRVAVVSYNDPGANVLSGFTSNSAAVRSAIARLNPFGGGDTPEHVFRGVVTAVNLDWRSDASRTIVVIGDAEPKDPEPGTGYTTATVATAVNIVTRSGVRFPLTVRALVRADEGLSVTSRQVGTLLNPPAGLLMVQIGSRSATRAAFQRLVGATKGKYFQAGNARALVGVLQKAFETSVGKGGGSGSTVVKRLRLTSMCWKGSRIHRMRVRNENKFSVDYSWEVYRTSRKGKGTAKPGNSYFEIGGVKYPMTVKLYWKNEKKQRKSTTKAVNKRKC